MTTRFDIEKVVKELEANPEMSIRLAGLSMPDRILFAEALINCGEWPVNETSEEFRVGFPSWVSWGEVGIY